jgi:chromosome segregation ATPase
LSANVFRFQANTKRPGGIECLEAVQVALAKKDEEIAELESKIKAVTADLTYNVGLVQQRDSEIRRLTEKIKETKKAIEAANVHEKKLEVKSREIEKRCGQLEDRVSDHLQKEESRQMVLSQAKAEFESTREGVNGSRQKLQQEALRRNRELEEQRSFLTNAIQAEEQKILNLQQIALQMRDTVRSEMDEMYAAHQDDMARLTAELAELEKGNEELIEALHDAKLRARSEVTEKQKLLERLMYEKAQIDREKSAESSAKLQRLKCELDAKLAKKKSLQREIETLSQSRRSREEVIEQLRIRYEQTESQIEQRSREVRRIRKQQRQEMDKLRQQIGDAKQTERDYRQRLEELRLAEFKDQEEWKRVQQSIEEYRMTLDTQYRQLHDKTEAAVAKLRDSESALEELAKREANLRQKAKSAAEELQRQHNEALRSKQALDEKRQRIAALKSEIAQLRAERREKRLNPKLSVIQIPPKSPEATAGDIPSELAIVGANPDWFALSPISSTVEGDTLVAKLRAELEEVRTAADEFRQHLIRKKAEVAAMKADGSGFDQLRKQNERLRAQKAEMEMMKEEISRFRQGRLAI